MLTYVIVGSGPSLSQEQIYYIREKQYQVEIVAVNDNYKLFPNANYVIAGDLKWWRLHYDDVCKTVEPHTWLHTIDGVDKPLFNNHKRPNIPIFPNSITRDITQLAEDTDDMYHGGCSGILGMELARLEGSCGFKFTHNTKIVLVGFDMQHTNGKSHWFGDHPKGFLNFNCAERWCKEIESMAPYYKKLGIDLVNCSIESALNPDIVRRSTLEKEII